MDDIIVYSDSWKDHVQHMRKVLERLRQAGLTANPAKCEWGGQNLEFLGHIVGEGGVSIPEARAAAIGGYVRPTTKKGL